MPKISVIVPVYKVEQYLNRCVDSILNQTFKDFELILVDDGSPDNCPAICDEYAAKYKFIHVIHKENGGLSDARNYGIGWSLKNSDSEWITFIDSDDWVHPQYLELLYNTCVDYDTVISSCGYEKLENYSEDIVAAKIINTDIDVGTADNLAVKNYKFEQFNITIAVARLYKKELWQDIRFPVGRLHEDEFTTYKVLFACDRIAVVKNDLYYYFQNENGIMQSPMSQKRINDTIDALYEQCVFFLEHNYNFVFNKTAKSLFFIVKKYYVDYKSNHSIQKMLISKHKYLYAIVKENLQFAPLFYKYGYKKWLTGRAEKIEDFKKDILLVRKEKGFVFSIFYYIKHFYKTYLGEV